MKLKIWLFVDEHGALNINTTTTYGGGGGGLVVDGVNVVMQVEQHRSMLSSQQAMIEIQNNKVRSLHNSISKFRDGVCIDVDYTSIPCDFKCMAGWCSC
eukprot:m.37488 g.37488  ORF g.37488 m.37488 type:complete len:99 (+) comp6737_c1_seq1:259-555(+)